MHAPDALTALGRIKGEHCDVTVVTREPMSVPAHTHDTTNHVLVTEGCLWITLNGTERAVRPGEWSCIPAGVEHAERFEERSSVVVFWVH